MGSAFMHGWVSLPAYGEVYLEHGLPRRVWVRDWANADVEGLAEQIADLTDLHVTLGTWAADEEAQGVEAEVHVNASDIDRVLYRLARMSAETFVDRYQKPIDADDVDYDDEAYAQDMGSALGLCGLHWGEIDEGGLRDRYRLVLHQASEEFARQFEQH